MIRFHLYKVPPLPPKEVKLTAGLRIDGSMLRFVAVRENGTVLQELFTLYKNGTCYRHVIPDYVAQQLGLILDGSGKISECFQDGR